MEKSASHQEIKQRFSSLHIIIDARSVDIGTCHIRMKQGLGGASEQVGVKRNEIGIHPRFYFSLYGLVMGGICTGSGITIERLLACEPLFSKERPIALEITSGNSTINPRKRPEGFHRAVRPKSGMYTGINIGFPGIGGAGKLPPNAIGNDMDVIIKKNWLDIGQNIKLLKAAQLFGIRDLAMYDSVAWMEIRILPPCARKRIQAEFDCTISDCMNCHSDVVFVCFEHKGIKRCLIVYRQAFRIRSVVVWFTHKRCPCA